VRKAARISALTLSIAEVVAEPARAIATWAITAWRVWAIVATFVRSSPSAVSASAVIEPTPAVIEPTSAVIETTTAVIVPSSAIIVSASSIVVPPAAIVPAIVPAVKISSIVPSRRLRSEFIRALRLSLRDLASYFSIEQSRVVTRRDRVIRFVLHRVLHERQSFRSLGLVILGHVHVQNVPVRFEQRANVVFARVPRNIAHEYRHPGQVSRVRPVAFDAFVAIVRATIVTGGASRVIVVVHAVVVVVRHTSEGKSK